MEHSDPYRLIAAVARRSRRRRRLDVLLPALPPCGALLAALIVGRLPLELAVAGLIALGVLLLYVVSLDVSQATAAAFLDRILGAKDHFLTLATLRGGERLRRVVEAGAVDIARRTPQPPPRRRGKRPLLTSVALSAAGFALLWFLPHLAVPAATGDSLGAIAAQLARSPDAADRRLAAALREVERVLGDPRSSAAGKLESVKAAIAEIDEAERQKAAAEGAASAPGEKGGGRRGGRGGTGEKSEERGQQPGGQGAGEGGGASDVRGRAREQLSKLAEAISAEREGEAAEQAREGSKPKPSGGGIRGPEGPAEERQNGSREAAGNQPSTSPEQRGAGPSEGAEGAQARARPESRRQNEPAAEGAAEGGGATAEGAGGRPSRASTERAQRYYGPGEGPGGGVLDGRYVRIRVPQDRRLLRGTEEVAKPGEVVPEVGYGNAPRPDAGSAGKVSTAQPLPLEYRGALGREAR